MSINNYKYYIHTFCPVIYMIPYMPPMAEFDEFGNSGDQMTRQLSCDTARLLSLFESESPESFTELSRYRMPKFFVRRILKSVIGYVLKNANMSEHPSEPAERYAEKLLATLLSRKPIFQRIFLTFGVPVCVLRGILLKLIIFVLKNMKVKNSIDPAVDRVLKIVENTTDVFVILNTYGISLYESRLAVTSIAEHIIKEITGKLSSANIEENLPKTIDEIINTTDIYNALISKGIPDSKARDIIKTTAYVSLKQVI
ncbi:MAG TPA: hypothetical protein DD426_00595 [Clostridiaceae bacterium]|nr:hypothetical protein [Clostridiaceae bacterium]